MRLANAYQLSRAVQVAARLGLGRLLRDGSRKAGDLASATGTDEGMLVRLLRFLAELGVVEELDDGRYGPTPLSERLHLIDNIAQGDEAWAVWGGLPEALRTGRSVFGEVHGASFYDYAARHPERAANWNAWTTAMARPLVPWIAQALSLAGTETVVDVGGGEGALLAEVLTRNPGCRGVLLDLPGAVERAAASLADAGVLDRCEVMAGDAFEGVPQGADVYVLSRVLMNLDDDDGVRMLARCREAMAEASVLKVVEMLMPDEPGHPQRRFLAASDLHHLLVWGGGHRTRGELEELFGRAGLRLVPVEGASGARDPGWQVVEGRRRSPIPSAMP